MPYKHARATNDRARVKELAGRLGRLSQLGAHNYLKLRGSRAPLPVPAAARSPLTAGRIPIGVVFKTIAIDHSAVRIRKSGGNSRGRTLAPSDCCTAQAEASRQLTGAASG